MSVEQNKAIIRRVFKEVFVEGDKTAANELYAPSYIHHDPSLPPAIQASREAYIQGLDVFHQAFPNFVMTCEILLAEGDKVAAFWVFQGVNTGEFMGIPATGREVKINGSAIYRLENDRLVEGWNVYDALGMLQQLGVAPTPQTTVV